MNILFLTTSRFSDGSAGAEREIVFGKLLRSLGYKVVFCTLADIPFGEVREQDGFEFVSFRKSGKSPIRRVLNYFYYKKNLKQLITRKYKDQIFDQIFVTDIPWNALEFIIGYARKKKIGLVHNSVEWYSPEEFKTGRFAVNYILNNLLNTTFIRPPFKVIGISSYLTDFFLIQGIKAIRIPFIVDTKAVKYEKNCSFEKLVLLYAGNAGRKDNLKEIIEGILLLSPQEIDRVEFRVFGVSHDTLINICNVDRVVLEKSKNFLKVFGSVPRNIVLSHLQEAHFTLLLRSEVQRYAKAGFPTKVTESLASGTPVITNLTSDLGLYLNDGVEGFIVPSCNSEAFAKTIRKALLLTKTELSTMQSAARKCAETKLDYRLFSTEMRSFLLN
ncbi:MAG: glycosyltransferase [Bacteroidota bacterium]